MSLRLPRRFGRTSRPPTLGPCRRCTRACRSFPKCRRAPATRGRSALPGIPIYGANGGWAVVPIDNRAHGRDERLPVQSLYDNVVHWELMLRDLAGK